MIKDTGVVVEVTRKRSGELIRKVFEILIANPEGLPAEAVLQHIEQSFPLTEFEMSPNPTVPCNKRFQAITHFGTIPPLKAGWLSFDEGRWAVTEEGRRAYSQFQDPEAFFLEAGRRSGKGWLAVHFPRFYSLAGNAKDQALIEYKLVQRIGPRQLVGHFLGKSLGASSQWQKVLPIQEPQRYIIPDLNLSTVDDLLGYLNSIGVACTRGGHTVYLPPQSIAESAFKVIARNYPQNAGIKIINNPGGIDDSTYISNSRKRISSLHKMLTNNHRYLSLVANLLYHNGVGPRLYDLIEMQCGEQLWTAYVIEHVDGRVPSEAECNAGLKKIREMEAEGLIKINLPDGFDDEDFQCPACNRNAFMDDLGRFQYIDFQNFILPDYGSYLKKAAIEASDVSHFGDKSLLRGWRYLYQSVPGVPLPARRSTDDRMPVLRQLMDSAGVSVNNRLVLDIGCNIGMMMAQYLKLGAKWCHGWDRSAMTPYTEQLLLALGCTRFSTSGGDIERGIDLKADLPQFLRPSLEGCAISYLAIQGHVGWLDALGQIPWSFLIYESHEDDTRKDFESYIEELKGIVDFDLAGVSSYRDGDCDERIIAVLKRK